jgi:uncharacterized membrane protein YphA (DoxX/SURF4 family)
MRSWFLVGRAIVGLYYLFSGFGGLGKVGVLAGYAASKGVPAPEVAVIVSHLLLILIGFCFLTGWRPALGVIAAVIFFVPVTLIMHAFWAETTAAGQQMQMIHFTKNIALLGSSLMFLAIPRPWPVSLDEVLARRRIPPGAVPA